MTKSILAVQEGPRVRLIVSCWTNKIVPLSLSLYCDMKCAYFLTSSYCSANILVCSIQKVCVAAYNGCYSFADQYVVHPQLSGCLFVIGVMISSDKVRGRLYDMLWHSTATNVEKTHLPLLSGVNYRWRKRSSFDIVVEPIHAWIGQLAYNPENILVCVQ